MAGVILALLGQFAVVHANYLDPGSGSYLLQTLMAGVLAGVFVARNAIARVMAVLARLRNRRSS